MAMERLPGQALSMLEMTEQSTPFRSTTADHILFGWNKPPLPSDSFTTVASLFCRLVTVFAGMLQVPSCARATEGAENSSPTADAIKHSLIGVSPQSLVFRLCCPRRV